MGTHFVQLDRCADSVEVDPSTVTTERVFEETIRQARTVWPLSASLVYAQHFCHRYTTRAVERYSGLWNVQPKNVVLVLGNQGEPRLLLGIYAKIGIHNLCSNLRMQPRRHG
jgi:hypothetical protein